jgi:septum site-determining protein MinD
MDCGGILLATMISVVSGKGGVGKTTVSVGLARALVDMNQKVLLVDTDWGLCSAEFLLKNVQSVYHVGDLLGSGVSLAQAVVGSEGEPDFLAAAHQNLTPEEIRTFALLLQEHTKDYDYVILDRPSGLDFSLEEALPSVTGLIVSGMDAMSLHGASLGAEGLAKVGVTEPFLVINRFVPALVKGNRGVNIDMACDQVGAQLLGIVPEDIAAAAYGQREKKSPTPYQKALERIACRLMGEWKPLPKLSKLTK